MVESGVRFLAEDDLRACSGGEFLMAGHEIGVKVRFDHVFDLQSLRFSFG
jgi:hypothetical protein